MTTSGAGASDRRVLRINGYLDVPAEAVDDFAGKFLYWLESEGIGFVPHRRDGMIREVGLDEVEIDLGGPGRGNRKKG